MNRVQKGIVGFAALALAWLWLAVLPAGAEGPALEIADTEVRYTYNFGNWDPETLSYQGSKGWEAEEGSGTITITNNDTDTAVVFLAFQQDTEEVPELTAVFADEDGAEQTEEGWEIEPGETKVIYLSFTSEAPTKEQQDAPLGSVLVYAKTLQAVVAEPAEDEDPAEEPDAPAEEEPAEPEEEQTPADPEGPEEEEPAEEQPEDAEEEEEQPVNPDDLPPPEDEEPEEEEPDSETGVISRPPDEELCDKGFGVEPEPGKEDAEDDDELGREPETHAVDVVADRIAAIGLTE